MEYPEVNNELSELIQRKLDGVLDDEQFNKLQSILKDNPSSVDHYVKTMLAISELRVDGAFEARRCRESSTQASFTDNNIWLALAEEEKTAAAVEVERPKESELKYAEKRKVVSTKRSISKLSLYTLVLSSAAMLFISVLVWLTPIKPLVATLTSDVNAKWLDEDSVLEEDGGIRVGKLMLVEGMARIDFYGGAQIILQSPAEIDFISQGKVYISRGKLVAKVGRDAIGFIVDTPDTKMLDLGTEFGVEVFRGGTEVHVFEGEVAVYPGNSEDKILVEQGQARQVDYNGSVKDLPANEFTFVRADEFDANLKANQGSAYHRWLSYNYQLDHDPGMVAHYTFEQDSGQPDILLNRAPASVDKLNGILGSTSHSKPDWVQGRWPQKSALKFEKEKNQRITIPADPALSIPGPITIVAWVQFSNEDTGGHLVSHRDKFKVNYQLAALNSQSAYSMLESHLEFRRYYSNISSSPKGFLSLKQPIKVGQWCLVAVTHDSHTVRSYINGVLLSSKKYDFKAEPVDAELVIGDVNIPGFAEKRFDGMIGELTIFKRALRKQELAEMYEAGKSR